jgi:hypothetical protein
MRCNHPQRAAYSIVAVMASLVLLVSSIASAKDPKPAPDNANLPAKVTGDEITVAQQEAIQVGLEFLAQRQKLLIEGKGFHAIGYSNHAGITALAGLAFLQAGNLPGRGKYGMEVQNCLDFVLQSCQQSGLIAAEGKQGEMYSHGCATLFLAEVYAMTGDNAVCEKLQKAVDLIIEAQNKEGGWRYHPVRFDADITVTVFQIMALRAARSAGIQVDARVMDKAMAYVRQCQTEEGGFIYTAGQSRTDFPRSAAGLCALAAGGGEGDEIQRGLRYVKLYIPIPRDPRFNEWSYYYGYYYAAQAALFIGGDAWDQLYPAMRDDTIGRRQADHWTSEYGDDYATAMALLILQMPNRRPTEAKLQKMIDGLAVRVGNAQAAIPGEAELLLLKRCQQYLNECTIRAAQKTPPDEHEMQALSVSQETIREVYDRLIQRLSKGRQKLAPPPDFKTEPPADAKKRDIADDDDMGTRFGDAPPDSMAVNQRVRIIGERMAQSCWRLAANDSGPVTQDIQKRLLSGLDKLIQAARQINLATNFEWSASGFDRLERIEDIIAALQNLRDRQAKLEERFRQANRDNLARTPQELSGDDRTQNIEMAQDQKDLARQTDETLRQLETAAKKQPLTDSEKQAMTRAADLGWRLDLSARQRQAADDMRQNLQAAARERQRAVEAGLDQIIAVLKDSNGTNGIRDAYVHLLAGQKEIGIALAEIAAASKTGDDLPRRLNVKLRLLPDKQAALIAAAETIGGQLKRLDSRVFDWAHRDVLNSMAQIRENTLRSDTGPSTRAAEKHAEEQLQAMIDSLVERPYTSNGFRRGKPKLPSRAELRLLKKNQEMVNDAAIQAARARPQNMEALIGLSVRQSEIRGVFDRVIQKVGAGKLKLGPPPDPKAAPPQARNKEQIENDQLDDLLLHNAAKTPSKWIESHIAFIGDRMAQSSQRLVAGKVNDVTWKIQRQIVLDLDVLVHETESDLEPKPDRKNQKTNASQ